MSSITPATRSTHGPFRQVVRTEEVTYDPVASRLRTYPYTARVEILACGHQGRSVVIAHGDVPVPWVPKPGSKRRCMTCGANEAALLAELKTEQRRRHLESVTLSAPRRGHLRLVQ